MNYWTRNLGGHSEAEVTMHLRRHAGPGSAKGKMFPKVNVNKKLFKKLQLRQNVAPRGEAFTLPGSLNPQKQA